MFADTNHLDSGILEEAARLWHKGELLAFPTETVYGLGANALNGSACSKIYQVKGRPSDNPLIVHVSDVEMARSLAAEWTDAAAKCAEHFWPGPLTMVMTKKEGLPDEITGGLPTVAIRYPSHPVAQALIAYAGLPIAAPSANVSGRPSPTSASHVWRDLRGKIPLIIDAGPCEVGLESTIIDLSGEKPVILRPGGISREQLEDVLGYVELDVHNDLKAPKAPGMKYRHYAPRGEMCVVVGSRKNVIDRMGKEIHKAQIRLKKVGILCTLESASQMHPLLPDLLFVLGSEARPEEVAVNLFEGLRLCDERHMDVILAEGINDRGIGLAIMNRLIKAAGYKIIQV